jgi:hypothetical protein
MDAVRDLSCASLQINNTTTRITLIVTISNDLNKEYSICIYNNA